MIQANLAGLAFWLVKIDFRMTWKDKLSIILQVLSMDGFILCIKAVYKGSPTYDWDY